MSRRLSIAELQNAGVSIRAFEAVAIAQHLIRSTSGSGIKARPPFGPPTPANVFLTPDGSVVCASYDATCAVSEVAIFLETLLPPGTPGVPGSLRYTVARALLEVDAPPFDSIQDFSQALSRFEQGSRADAIRALVARAATPPAERRRTDPAVATLRRQLRESDARVYDQQQALDALTAMTPTVPRPPRRSALAAGLAIGVALVGAGEWMHVRETPAAAATVEQMPPSVSPAVQDIEKPAAEPHAVVVTHVADTPAAATPTVETPPIETPAIKPALRSAAPVRERPRERRSPFRWLKTRFAVRADPL